MKIAPFDTSIAPGFSQRTLQRSECGHRSSHVVRFPAASGWNEICVACWRRRRLETPMQNDREVAV